MPVEGIVTVLYKKCHCEIKKQLEIGFCEWKNEVLLSVFHNVMFFYMEHFWSFKYLHTLQILKSLIYRLIVFSFLQCNNENSEVLLYMDAHLTGRQTESMILRVFLRVHDDVFDLLTLTRWEKGETGAVTEIWQSGTDGAVILQFNIQQAQGSESGPEEAGGGRT